MKYAIAAALCILYTGCGSQRPAYVTVPQKQFRSAEPMPLPLQPPDRDRLLAFFSHDGNQYASGTVPDAAAQAHRQVLDALADRANLSVEANKPAREFCAMAASLCGHAPLFLKRLVVQQVVDARDDRPPFPPPLAVSDGHYWWIFRHSHGVLTELVVVRAVNRNIERQTP